MTPSRLRKVSFEVLSGLALAVLAIILFGWIAEEMMENDTAHFDAFVRTQAHALASPAFTRAMEIMSFVGSPIPVVVLTVIAAVSFWYRGYLPRAVTLAIAVAGAGILEFALKLCFQRARPVPFFDIPAPHSYSFPSGHALGALCFYGMLAHEMTAVTDRRALQWLLWMVAVIMILVIGFSRIYLGVHYPSDVVAGYVAGVVWLMAMILAEREFPKWRHRRGEEKGVLKHV